MQELEAANAIIVKSREEKGVLSTVYIYTDKHPTPGNGAGHNGQAFSPQ